MKLPWSKSDSTSAPSAEDASPEAKTADHAQEKKPPKGYTPPKGRPTPKREDVERARGIKRDPVQPPETAAEARARKKALKASMTKEEYKAYKQEQKQKRRSESQRLRERIDRGDESVLLERDRGEVRRFARDWVDSRRFLANLVMPLAAVLLVVMIIGTKFPAFANASSLVAMVIIFLFAIEGINIGKRVNKAARERFPSSDEPGLALGFYAYTRASQLRNLRSPRPRVEIGDTV